MDEGTGMGDVTTVAAVPMTAARELQIGPRSSGNATPHC
jgi:hypothetical protein